MFKSTDVIDDPHHTNASIVRLIGDMDWARSTHTWIKNNGLDCDSPLPAIWEGKDHFKVYGYQIRVRENVI